MTNDNLRGLPVVSPWDVLDAATRGEEWVTFGELKRAREQLATDLAAAIAERDKLRSLCACAYQMAGYHDAPVKWLDAFGDAASGTPLSEWRLQANDLGDALLPYSPDTESPEAAIARAEAAEAALRTAREYVVTELECQRDNFKGFEHCSDIDSVTADLAAIDAAIAAQQAEGE